MTHEASATVVREVACPLCGQACDDLSVDTAGDALTVVARGCVRAHEGFARLGLGASAATPRVAGRPATLEEACSHAARLLAESAQPVFGGMALDVSGARGAMELVDLAGGVVDHMNNEFGWRASRVMQDGGDISTTLAEVKNRADLILLVGTDAVSVQPRFFERCVWVEETMFDLPPASRRIVYLGRDLDTQPGHSPDGRPPEVFEVERDRLPEALSLLRARVAGQPVAGAAPLGIALERWQALADLLRAAKYSVIVWTGPSFVPSQVDLNAGAVVGLVRALNTTTRCNSLLLGGNDGDLSMGAVHLWQTGFPMRTSYASGEPKFDAVHNGLARLLATGEADALVWLSSLNDRQPPPPVSVPVIVIAPPSLELASEPQVYIPVATPGMHHAGHFVRTDKVVTLPLQALRRSALPAAGDVARAIAARLKAVQP